MLDICRKLNLIAVSATDDNKALLERIAQMLTKLIKSSRPTDDPPAPAPEPEPGLFVEL